MFINKENFPYQIKKEYLTKAKIFKTITLIYLFCYLGAIITFIVLSYPIDKEARGFLTWMACFGFIPLPILWGFCKEKLYINVPLLVGQTHNWAYGPYCNELVYPKNNTQNEKKNFFQKLLKDKSQEPYWQEKGPAWEFLDILNEINLYGNIQEAEKDPYYLGEYCNRIFRLDFADLFNKFSFTDKHNKRHFVNFKGFILRTTLVENIKSTILIRSKSTFAKKIKNLQKVEIDTQDLFEVYTNNPQTLGQELSPEFISELISYGKNIDKTVTILITPEGILCTKPESGINAVIFTSLRNAFIKEWAKYENFINLLDLINLLESKK